MKLSQLTTSTRNIDMGQNYFNSLISISQCIHFFRKIKKFIVTSKQANFYVIHRLERSNYQEVKDRDNDFHEN